ncbi:MAG: RnfABCDGE type electron transport complex subunit D [Candidatus Saccharimonadales bacterium]
MFEPIDRLLDKITSYRLMLYYLAGLLLAAVVLSLAGDIQYNPLAIIASVIVLAATSWAVNIIFARIFKAPTNNESWLITALILALIITPKFGIYNITFLIVAAGLAMASKYILTIKNTHIFNPAAIAVTLTALGPHQNASWWIGTAVLVPFVIIGGLLLTRKIHRGPMVASFFGAVLVATVIYSLLGDSSITESLHRALLGSPVLFLGFVMLTEPLTSPSTRNKQVWYAVLVGALLPPQIRILNFYPSPEFSLIIGNIFSAIVSPKIRLFPALKSKARIATNVIDFTFTPGQKLAYKPGQFMEWTLPHKAVDSRGNRRYFSLASSPTEPDLRLGIKFNKPGSSYKQAMLSLKNGVPIVAAQVAGDFTLPKDTDQKLVFIAGGIGITPFRSMIKYLCDTNERRDIILIYAARSQDELAYQPIFETARQQLGISTHYILSSVRGKLPNFVHSGHVSAKTIQELIPDYIERNFYISGSQLMVASIQHSLAELNVPRRHIKLDRFPGYTKVKQPPKKIVT